MSPVLNHPNLLGSNAINASLDVERVYGRMGMRGALTLRESELQEERIVRISEHGRAVATTLEEGIETTQMS